MTQSNTYKFLWYMIHFDSCFKKTCREVDYTCFWDSYFAKSTTNLM